MTEILHRSTPRDRTAGGPSASSPARDHPEVCAHVLEVVGPYQIDAPLGAAGMGVVCQATDTRLDRTVAIKVLPEHVAAEG